jgi:hypothetical protein
MQRARCSEVGAVSGSINELVRKKVTIISDISNYISIVKTT